MMRQTIRDTGVMTWRSVLRYVRQPRLLAFSTIQPVMFTLLFAFVFGGAIETGEIGYIDFLLPGIFIQAVIFGATQTGVGLAEDIAHGMMDRLRTLPMSRLALVTGRILADGARNAFVIVIMVASGLLIGFRFHGGVGDALAAYLLAVAFGVAFSTLSAWIGVSAKGVEAAQVAQFIWVMPLVFISSISCRLRRCPPGSNDSRRSIRLPSPPTRCARCRLAPPTWRPCG